MDLEQIKQTSLPNTNQSTQTNDFYRSQSIGITIANQKALVALSDYQTVKDLIFCIKGQKDLPGLSSAKLTTQDMDKNPLVLRNIFMALAERHELESNLVLFSKKLTVKQREKLSEAHKVIADAFLMSASGLKPLNQAEKLRFGTRFYNGKSFGTRFAEANLIIHSFSAGAGITGFFLSPIPFAGPAGLTIVTYSMLKQFGKKLYDKDLGVSMTGIASMAGAALGPHLANQLWHLIPGVGQAIVAASEGASSSIMHEAFGWFYFAMFEAQLANGGHPRIPDSISALSQIASVFMTGFSEQNNPNHSPEAFNNFIQDLRERLD